MPRLIEQQGEAAAQQARHEDEHLREIAPAPWERVPGTTGADARLMILWVAPIPGRVSPAMRQLHGHHERIPSRVRNTIQTARQRNGPKGIASLRAEAPRVASTYSAATRSPANAMIAAPNV